MRIASRVAILRLLLRRNGLRWLLQFGCAEVARRVSRRLDSGLADLEKARALPGFYDGDIQREVWNAYDWSGRGEEWTASEVWKRSVVAAVLEPHIGNGDVLEIGPGAGRWSAELQRIARHLTLVDVSSACIEQCKARLAGCPNVTYFVNDGRTLPVESGQFDRVWSFDVFVHISEENTSAYLREIWRVLRPGGRAVIHHTADGGLRGPWRSRMTSERFADMGKAAGLRVVTQFESWEHGSEHFDLRATGDNVTILEKPSN